MMTCGKSQIKLTKETKKIIVKANYQNLNKQKILELQKILNMK